MYPPFHCETDILCSAVNEDQLWARRKVASLIFLQKLIHGQINCPVLLDLLHFVCPRTNNRTSITFYFDIPRTQHHFNSPLITSLRLYNISVGKVVDIFYDNFCKANIRKKLFAILYDDHMTHA